jgi:acetyltransferase
VGAQSRAKERAQGLRRPLRPEDEELFVEFLKHVSSEDLRLRFFARLPRSTTRRLRRARCQYRRDDGVGVRLHADANHETGEYAILLRSDLRGQGLGWELMQLMME